MLNRAGVSVSYDTAWNCLRQLTAETKCLEVQIQRRYRGDSYFSVLVRCFLALLVRNKVP